MDHFTGYLFVYLQRGTSALETIQAKIAYEQHASTYGVDILGYHGDNGRFAETDFKTDCLQKKQRLTFCEVSAHHQNGIAERSILTISNMARALLLHTSMRLKDGIDSSLSPMAVDYAVYIYNRTPKENGLAPIDLFAGKTYPRPKLKDSHVWGCPVYLLDPKLQNGQKLPR